MRICIFSPEEELCESLALGSQGAGYQVDQKFSEPRKLEEFISGSTIDHIVLIDVRRQREPCLQLIKNLLASRPRAMVAVANESDSRLGAQAIEAGAQALLVEDMLDALALQEDALPQYRSLSASCSASLSFHLGVINL